MFMYNTIQQFHTFIAGASLASSFILSSSVPMYLSIYVCMFVRKIFYRAWTGNGLANFDEIGRQHRD